MTHQEATWNLTKDIHKHSFWNTLQYARCSASFGLEPKVTSTIEPAKLYQQATYTVYITNLASHISTILYIHHNPENVEF